MSSQIPCRKYFQISAKNEQFFFLLRGLYTSEIFSFVPESFNFFKKFAEQPSLTKSCGGMLQRCNTRAPIDSAAPHLNKSRLSQFSNGASNGDTLPATVCSNLLVMIPSHYITPPFNYIWYNYIHKNVNYFLDIFAFSPAVQDNYRFIILSA